MPDALNPWVVMKVPVSVVTVTLPPAPPLSDPPPKPTRPMPELPPLPAKPPIDWA